MNVEQRYQGAFTYADEDSQATALQVAEDTLGNHADTYLTMEYIKPLGLHITVSHHGVGPREQVKGSVEAVRQLAIHAYSGYVDVTVNDDKKRYHAKELNPVETKDVNDILD